jgi:hypothetical protein
MAEFNRLTKLYQATGKMLNKGKPISKLDAGTKVLTDLVSQQVALSYARLKNAYPTDQQVERQLTIQKRLDPAFIKSYTKSGRTMADIRNSIRVSLAMLNVLSQRVTVSPKEIAEEYKTVLSDPRPNPINIPAIVGLRVILILNPQAKAQAEAELKAGASFTAVCKKYADPGLAKIPANRGGPGRLPETDVYRVGMFFGPEVSKAVQATPVGKTTPWIQVSKKGPNNQVITAFIIAKVETKKPGKIMPLNEDIKELIRQTIVVRKSDQADYRKSLESLRNKIQIDITTEPWKSHYAKVEATKKP